MVQELKYAKHLTEQDILEFLESTNRINIDRNKQPHFKVCKHEIILVGNVTLLISW